MKRLSVLMVFLIAASGSASHAQDAQPYRGLHTRAIKALSDQQIDDLKSGRGMGLALAAELNGHPGPIHVLELADRLELTPVQRDRMSELVAAMKAEAIPIGEKLVTQEAELERQFVTKSVSDASLVEATQAIGATQAALRAAHLKYHVSTLAALKPGQVERYMALRGYANSASPHQSHHRRGH